MRNIKLKANIQKVTFNHLSNGQAPKGKTLLRSYTMALMTRFKMVKKLKAGFAPSKPSQFDVACFAKAFPRAFSYHKAKGNLSVNGLTKEGYNFFSEMKTLNYDLDKVDEFLTQIKAKTAPKGWTHRTVSTK